MPEAADLLTPELRQALHQELHARPPQALVAPLAVTHWVQWIDEAERAASRQYLSELMAGAGLPAPAPEAAFVQAGKIARLMIDGAPRALTMGATHFHTTGVRPDWSRRFDRTAAIGQHLFYRP